MALKHGNSHEKRTILCIIINYSLSGTNSIESHRQ